MIRRPGADDVPWGRVGAASLGGHGGEDAVCPTTSLRAEAEAAASWVPDEWDGPVRHAVLADLDRVIATLVTVRGAVLVAEQEAGTWRGSGDPSMAAWRARRARVGKREAAAQVRRAEGLAAVPRAAQAVTAGRIGSEHAGVIARLASTGSEAQRSVVTSPEGQVSLVQMAARLDADAFATAAARYVAEHDPQGSERDHQEQRAARFLHLATTPSGTLVRGRLDNMAGHRLRLALEAVTPRPAVDDDRDPGQRAADALDSIAQAALADVETKPGGHVPPQVTMILTAAQWAAARSERDRRLAGTGTGTVEGTAAGGAAGPGALEDGTPVPGSELARVMCDAAVTRLVIDAESQPLDVGRAERVFTGSRRRAVVARDRHCGWPGCRMNARWCQVHHLDWWDRDHDRTDVRRGVLLCSFHHHEVHRRDLQLHSVGGGQESGDVALVRYEVRDRAGRVIHGRPSAAGSAEVRTGGGSDVADDALPGRRPRAWSSVSEPGPERSPGGARVSAGRSPTGAQGAVMASSSPPTGEEGVLCGTSGLPVGAVGPPIDTTDGVGSLRDGDNAPTRADGMPTDPPPVAA